MSPFYENLHFIHVHMLILLCVCVYGESTGLYVYMFLWGSEDIPGCCFSRSHHLVFYIISIHTYIYICVSVCVNTMHIWRLENRLQEVDFPSIPRCPRTKHLSSGLTEDLANETSHLPSPTPSCVFVLLLNIDSQYTWSSLIWPEWLAREA